MERPRIPALLPIVLLLLQAALLHWLYERSGFAPKSYPDTIDYTFFAQQTWTERLTSLRTIGYPIFLYLHSLVADQFRLVPLWHFLLHIATVVVFQSSLLQFGFRTWTAFLAASALVYASILRYFGHAILTDAPGTALIILLTALLLFSLTRPRSRWWLAGLGVGLFVSYQVRPANLYLVALIPLLGGMLYPLTPGNPATRCWTTPDFRRHLQRLTLVSLVPFLLFCGLRWVTVGHFGLVSFGGHNAIGVLASLVQAETVDQLDPEVRPLARAIAAERERRGMEWPFSRLGWIRYEIWFKEYNPNSHEVALPAALKLAGGSRVEANRMMTRLSWAILFQHPDLYARWVVASFAESLCGLVRREATLQATALLLLLAFTAARMRPRLPEAAVRQQERETTVLLLISLLFFLSGTLLVVLVEQPLERYIFSTAVFIPSLLAAVLSHQLTRLLARSPTAGDQ
ncbi:MAG: hypothetical protein HQL82_12795 [Magnetococcales bacterium]|nr:hypothetical protein [Magnetococcales bacterium]